MEENFIDKLYSTKLSEATVESIITLISEAEYRALNKVKTKVYKDKDKSIDKIKVRTPRPMKTHKSDIIKSTYKFIKKIDKFLSDKPKKKSEKKSKEAD